MSVVWPSRRLDEVAEVRLGRQRSPQRHQGPKMRLYLRAANVTWAGLNLVDLKEMDFTDAEMATYRLMPGDLLLSEASGSPGEVGKPALWRGEIEDCAFQNTLLRVRPKEHDSRFLLYLFRGLALNGAFVPESRGVGINHLGRANLAALRVPVPPLPEQVRIVEVVEELLSHLDAADASVLVAQQRAARLRKSILQDLIPEPVFWPSDWTTTTIGHAGDVQLGRQRHPDWHDGPNMHPYLRVANVFEDRIDLADVMEMHWEGDTFDRFRLRPGDILLNEGQSPELLGRPAMYRGHPESVAFTNTLIRFRAAEGVAPEFALLVFRRYMHSGRFKQESRITTNIGHLSASRLKGIEFPVPPWGKQEEIVSAAKERLDSLERLDSAALAAERRSAALRRAVLGAAFSGQLTGRSSDTEIIEETADKLVAQEPLL